jgi:hypothetical protein
MCSILIQCWHHAALEQMEALVRSYFCDSSTCGPSIRYAVIILASFNLDGDFSMVVAVRASCTEDVVVLGLCSSPLGLVLC